MPEGWTNIPPGDDGWNGNWTPEMLEHIREMHDKGYCVDHITDQVLEEHNGPARWQNTRDRMKEMWPGENVKGDPETCPDYHSNPNHWQDCPACWEEKSRRANGMVNGL